MGLMDFSALTVPELAAVVRAWDKMQRDSERREWERLRVSVCLTLQPFLSERLSPTQLLPLPWDGPERARNNPDGLSRQEQKERYDFYRQHGRWPS